MKDESEFVECARRLKALADPDRLRIIQQLFDGEQNVGELAAALGQEVVKVSHHLGVLKGAGLVTASKQGRFMIYALHPEVRSKGRPVEHIDLGCCRLDLVTIDAAKRR